MAEIRQASTLLVEFEATDGACSVSLERNSEDAAGTFRVYHGGNDYAVYTNIPGSCIRVARNIPENVEDVVQFAVKSTAELSRVPSGGVRCDWIGLSGGNVTISGQTVRLAAVVNARVLQARYATRYDLWRLPGRWSAYSTALVVARCGDESASISMDPDDPANEVSEGESESLTFTTDTTTEEEQSYTITVVDYCTGDPIPDANVSTAYGGGTTDAEGKVEIGPIPGGKRVEVQVTVSGYKDNQTDTLNNEWFKT